MTSNAKDFKYVITSGWWCGPDSEINNKRTKYGSESIRSLEFFDQWHAAIDNFTNPVKILIVDSASHHIPTPHKDPRVELVSLDENAGHSTSHLGKYAGVSRAHLCGMVYALSCNVDYWVYIEQDALIHGKGIVEHAISSMTGDILFGDGNGTPQPMQQSFMIMKTSAIPRFIERFTAIRSRDAEISPEMKFWIASHGWATYLPECIFQDTAADRLPFGIVSRVRNLLISRGRNFGLLPFGYGRTRPINFTDQFYYFQHGTVSELESHGANTPN